MKMDYTSFVQKYEAHKNEFELPEFKELDYYFEVYDLFLARRIELTYQLRNIRRLMVDKLWNLINYFHNFLSPHQQSLIAMEESKRLTEDDKKKIDALMKDFLIIARKSVSVEVQADAKKDAEYIMEIFTFWKAKHNDILSIADRHLELWKNELDEIKDSSYYG